MLGKIFGFILLVFVGVFSICSCKVASWADQEMEESLDKERKENEYRDFYSRTVERTCTTEDSARFAESRTYRCKPDINTQPRRRS